ncbi:hypothetical protein NKH77_28780 [Streptomyces sp. M19]
MNWVSVPVEGALERAPFDRLFLVGLDGDGRAAQLLMRDGASVPFSYGRVVDYLYARVPALTAVSADTAVLVMGADVAGPPSRDPLERPMAGQALANGWGRWVWVSGSGLEPGIASGVQMVNGRQQTVGWLQLADGDWLAGFRPEPSSAELASLARRVTGDPNLAENVLRWVRATRLVYGPLLEDDRGAFEALLHGFWVLDQERAARGDRGPLTWSTLRDMGSSYFASTRQLPPPLPQALPLLMGSVASAAGVYLALPGFALVPRFASPRAWDQARPGPPAPAPAPAPAPPSIAPEPRQRRGASPAARAAEDGGPAGCAVVRRTRVWIRWRRGGRSGARWCWRSRAPPS